MDPIRHLHRILDKLNKATCGFVRKGKIPQCLTPNPKTEGCEVLHIGSDALLALIANNSVNKDKAKVTMIKFVLSDGHAMTADVYYKTKDK